MTVAGAPIQAPSSKKSPASWRAGLGVLLTHTLRGRTFYACTVTDGTLHRPTRHARHRGQCIELH
jgi:hypothetical protein